jgi:alkylated DNA repair protein alkB family protein 8
MTFNDKRLQRLRLKTRKKFARLEPSSDIKFMEHPSPFLFVGNGGLECGVDHEILHDIFSEHGVVKKIVMKLHRPYAFVEMSDVMSEDQFKQVDGKRLTSSLMSPPPAIHLAYISHLPEPEACTDVNPTLCSMQMITLPKGLQLIPDFVNKEEEDRLLSLFAIENDDLVSGKLLKHRRVTHYGYEFIYGSNDIDLKKPLQKKIPSTCDFLIKRMIVEGLLKQRPDQLTVNEYEPGQGRKLLALLNFW